MTDSRSSFATSPAGPAPDVDTGTNAPAKAPSSRLERYRQYLTVLARAQVADAGLRDRLDLSGVVQQTFLEAHQKLGAFRGQAADSGDSPQLAAWLRQILSHNLADALRTTGRAKRGAARERSIERELGHSSLRLGQWLAAGGPSPSQHAQHVERALALADALALLPEAQREVVMLRHWHGWPLARVAAHLGRSPASVVGLLQRGLRTLREALDAAHRRGEL